MSTPVHEINQKQISQNLAFHCQKKTQTHTHTHTHTHLAQVRLTEVQLTVLCHINLVIKLLRCITHDTCK